MSDNLFELQQQLTNMAVAECNKVRAENKLLKQQMAAMPGVAWELQQRVDMLEIELRRATSKGTPS